PVGGSERGALANATRIGAGWGYDEVNLNCGCPSDRVQAGRFGACLMREPSLVAECVAAMIEGAAASGRNVPVTVKCRLGVDEDHEDERFAAVIDAVAARSEERRVGRERGARGGPGRSRAQTRHGWKD